MSALARFMDSSRTFPEDREVPGAVFAAVRGTGVTERACWSLLVDLQRERFDNRRPQRNVCGKRKSKFFRC
jgi:hypothetical protein